MLTAVPITTDSKDFKEIKHLYIAAFPKSERVPLRDLLRHDGASEFVAGYDGETFCGFYSALTFGDITHILFLAIDERLRAHGYGSAMLDIVAAAHPHNRIIVDAEAEDPAASNNAERVLQIRHCLHLARSSVRDTHSGRNHHRAGIRRLLGQPR